jgi:simple sugar transport system ATP-binding protein
MPQRDRICAHARRPSSACEPSQASCCNALGRTAASSAVSGSLTRQRAGAQRAAHPRHRVGRGRAVASGLQPRNRSLGQRGRPREHEQESCLQHAKTVAEIHQLSDVNVTVDVVWVDERREREVLRPARDDVAPTVEPISAPDDVLRTEHVSKRFGEVVALRDVNVHLRRGEALGLIGDNASGKSTLIKILSGFHRPDAGRMIVQGAPVALSGVDHARSLGIDCVYQDLALIDQLSIWENVFLRREAVRRPLPFLARRRMRACARRALDDVGVCIRSVDLPVGSLSGGQRQAVAVARSMCSGAQILLLDEPIAAMGAREAMAMLEVIGRLRAERSMSMLFVAHNYAHVLMVCDRVNLLEDGRIVLDQPVSQTSIAELTDRMTASLRRH